MPLTPQEVASKVFGPTRMRRGYDENEVDAFLDQVEAELTRLHAENDRLRSELEKARAGLPFDRSVSVEKPPAPQQAPVAPPVETPAPVPAEPAEPAAVVAEDQVIEQRVTRMLVLAQQTADAAVTEAQTEAERVRTNALAESERVLAEARMRATEELGSLDRDKRGLQGAIEHLQTFEQEYRQRLRAYFEMQLRDLEDEPVLGSLPAVEGRGSEAIHGGYPRQPAGFRSPGNAPVSGDAFDVTEESESGAASSALSTPAGFGQVWAPEETRRYDSDPLVTGQSEHSGRAAGSPFDTGADG